MAAVEEDVCQQRGAPQLLVLSQPFATRRVAVVAGTYDPHTGLLFMDIGHGRTGPCALGTIICAIDVQLGVARGGAAVPTQFAAAVHACVQHMGR